MAGAVAKTRETPGGNRGGEMGRSTKIAQRLVAAFLFGMLLFNFPLLAVFNRPADVLGIPVLYLYLFAAWGLLIALFALIVERPH
jgi:hypothetical protein